MLNLSSPVYCISATTSSASVTISNPQIDLNTITVSNAGAQNVFVTSSVGATTAVYPTSSATAFSNGAVVRANETLTFKKNPTHNTIAVIRPAGASAANVYLKIGSDV